MLQCDAVKAHDGGTLSPSSAQVIGTCRFCLASYSEFSFHSLQKVAAEKLFGGGKKKKKKCVFFQPLTLQPRRIQLYHS